MRTAVVALVCGVVFGAALAVSGAGNPRVILGFLDIAGDFRPQLVAAIAVAVAVNLCLWPRVLRWPRPILAKSFPNLSRTDVDGQLIGGACLFGVGWGLSGYCVGPALTSLVGSASSAAIYLGAVIVGSVLHAVVTAPRAKA